MHHDRDETRLSRLTDAVEAYLDHRQDPRADDQAFLDEHVEIRDLLEAMMHEDDEGPSDERAKLQAKPRFLGDFEILREIGRGGMGVVYEATQVSLGRRVALKVLPAHLTLSPRQIERFRREAAAAAKLKHEGIVPIHAIGSVDGAHFYAMEYVEGRSLHDAIDDLPRRGNLGVSPNASRSAEAAEVAAQIAEALAYSHEQGLVHRDIKPHNILIDSAGRARLVDFGLAKDLTAETLTNTSTGAGTPYYMSPEQVDAPKSVDARSDVFALGIVLYEMLTGARPFDGSTTQQVIRAVTTQEISSVRNSTADVPRDLETICLKALAKQPDDRYQSSAECAADLRRFLNHEPIHAKPPATAVRLAKLVRRHRALTAALAFAALIAVVSAVWISTQAADQRRRDQANQAQSEEAILSLIDVALSTTVPRRAGDEQRCLARLEEAATICDGLLQKQGNHASLRLRRRFVDLLTYMGEFYRQRAEESKALTLHAKALTIARTILEEEPTSFASLSQCSATFSRWYGLLLSHERRGLAEFDTLVERMQSLDDLSDPALETERQRTIAASLAWRATMRLEAREDLESVRHDLETADAIFGERRRRIAALSGTNWLMTRLYLANLHLVTGDPKRADEIVAQTWREFAPILEVDPQNRGLRVEAAQLHSMHARVLVGLRKSNASIRASGKAIRIREGLAKDFPRSTENMRLLAVEEIEVAKKLSQLKRFDKSIETARSALRHAEAVAETLELRQVRATARNTIAAAMMHRARSTTGVASAPQAVIDGIRSLYCAALDEQRALTKLAEGSTRFAFSLGATACNRASWELTLGNTEVATTLAREAFENGKFVATQRDPSIPAARATFRMQCHVLVDCLLRSSRARDAFHAACDFFEVQFPSSIDSVSAALHACRASKALAVKNPGDDETLRLVTLYRETAIDWLRDSVRRDHRVLAKNAKHAAFAVIADRDDFRELVAQATKALSKADGSAK